MCQIFSCSVIQGVSFNYHQSNVRSRVSASNFQVSVSAFMTNSRWHTQIIFMGGFIQWNMVVICLCAVFVTSQFDVIFRFPNQRFGEVC